VSGGKNPEIHLKPGMRILLSLKGHLTTRHFICHLRNLPIIRVGLPIILFKLHESPVYLMSISIYKEEITMEKERMDKRLWLGIIILLAGLLLMAKNFGLLYYPLDHYIFRWEMILIVLGLVFIINNSNRTTGIILLFIGLAFYVNHTFHLHYNFWQLFLPAMLILTGVLVMFRDKIDRYRGKIIISDEENMIDDTAIFGGGDRIIRSQHFKGGRITAVFGGSRFDMLKTKLEPGKNVIDVFCLFGGTNLVIPDDWNIKIRTMSIFGGFGDKRRVATGTQSNEETQLIITGLVIFGGGEIKSYMD
jgi:predicted membrane protein